MKIRILKKNFGIVDGNVYADPSVSIEAKALYGLICCHSDEHGRCYPSVARLSRLLNKDMRSIYRYLAELKEKNILTRCGEKEDGKSITQIYDSPKETWNIKFEP